ncbi:MAG: UDP-N-acetylmuramoyl-L-alanyl-D-glutamate--2,6-diaminopimelate ligase [Bacteroidales bacterium]
MLYKSGLVKVAGSTDRMISNVSFDSRQVEKDSLFVAIKGIKTDGHLFIQKAEENGAACIVCQDFPENQKENITYVQVEDSSLALSFIAANFYDKPSEKIKLIGVTGTNGKTTVASLLHETFISLGHKSGLISTVSYKINKTESPSAYTTPDAIAINELLSKMIDEGCEYCFMEVSSHAVVQNRTTALHFAGGIFTNLSQDHLDYHKDFKQYLLAKKAFFDMLPAEAFALTNVDDKNGWVMLQNTKAKKYSYSILTMADYRAKIIDNTASGLVIDFMGVETYCKLVGSFNAYNLLAILSAACLLGEDRQNVLTVLSGLDSVEGRFHHIVSPANVNAIVDYAHTPDALENVLKTIKDIIKGKKSKVITVFGCGGNRDESKRPIMGAIAAKYSDKVIVTTDNPRYENHEKITEDIIAGIDPKSKNKTIIIPGRKEAIKTACSIAGENDIILVAGKGHEKYQEINGIKHHFDDVEIVMECFEINNHNTN